MFVLNDDLSIYATRGDIVFFAVQAQEDGEFHTFKPGDVVRIKIYGKKDANTVVLEKDFPVTAETESVEIFLDGEDTKIGGVISKPKVYWYEVELNPLSNPQTIIGYDDDGAKEFKLFPEGADLVAFMPDAEDVPFIDTDLDLTSPRPVENQAVARAIVQLKAAFEETREDVTEKTEDAAQAIAGMEQELRVERNRIDTLIALPEGSTTNDARLEDICNGADEVQYSSPGDAVREQMLSKLNNLVKADRAIAGAYISATGSIVANEAYSYVEVAVIPRSTVAYRYTVDNGILHIAFYDIDGVKVVAYPCKATTQYITVPENAYTLKATYNANSYLALVHDVADIAAAIEAERRANAEQSKTNITHRLASEVIAGAYIRVSDGNISSHDAYSYIEMPAVPCSTILYTFTSNQSMAGLAFYDADDAFISSVLAINGTQELTVPENAVKIRATAKTTDDVVIVGDVREIAQGISRNARIIAELTKRGFGAPSIHIPSQSVAVVGREWNLYFDNVILCDNIENYDVRCSISPTLTEWGNYGEFLRITPTAPGTHTVTISVYNKFFNEVIASKSFTLHVISNEAVEGRKVIFIGDSLTDTAYYPAEIQHNLSGGGIQSLGTRTATMKIGSQSLTVNHEGRAGWSTYDYFTESAHNKDNAFYNPTTATFDFSYYMENQGYTDVDIVSIFLGTNGVNRTDNVANIKAMIESIHAYDANIVVLVNLINMPATQTGYGYRKFDSTANNFKHAVFALNDKYIENFDSVMENVYVSEVYFNLDSKRDYGTVAIPASARRATEINVQTNNVHPDSAGYMKFADVIYCNLLYHLTK